jgi:hypothetical protein
MKNSQSHAEDGANQAKLVDLIPKMKLSPWEDEAAYEALWEALFAELKPKGYQESALTQDIVDCHWDHYRSKQLSQDLTDVSFRKAAHWILLEKQKQTETDIVKSALADAFGSPQKQDFESALATLEELGVSHAEFRVRAFLDHLQAIEILAQRPGRFDQRRRDLLADLDQLKARRKLAEVEDAEVLVDHGDA